MHSLTKTRFTLALMKKCDLLNSGPREIDLTLKKLTMTNRVRYGQDKKIGSRSLVRPQANGKNSTLKQIEDVLILLDCEILLFK